MNSVSPRLNKVTGFIGKESEFHRWEYLTFTIIVITCFFFAFLSEVTHLNEAINYLSDGDLNLANEIRRAPLEHFAPTTIAYGTALLYLLTSAFRLLFGTSERQWVGSKDIY